MRYYFLAKNIICFTTGIVLIITFITVGNLFKSNIKIGNSKMRIFPVKKHFNIDVHGVHDNFYKDSKNEQLKIKYILLWTSPKNVPFVYMGRGQQEFIKRSCKFYNCYVTSNPHYLGDITKFDVVAFSGPEVTYMKQEKLPQKRSPHQKYAFASIESSHYYPLCDKIFDGYFNWTWTFKLDSDTRWGYITIRNEEGDIIGPNKEMHWIKNEDMKPVSKDILSILKGKSKLAATFVSNCDTVSRRETFGRALQIELKKYNLTIDVYGKCGKLKCDRSDEELCDGIIEKDYFFYLAFENSFSEDYVTEKILHGLRFSAIPVVYGGANYSRFMPDGSYLDARKLGVRKLAKKMNHLMHNMEKYSTYFKWRNHYSYHKKGATVETDDYCGICALLNDEKKINETSVYQDLRQWWNPANFSCPDGLDKMDEYLMYLVEM